MTRKPCIAHNQRLRAGCHRASRHEGVQVRLVLVDSIAFPFRMHRVEWRQQMVFLHELASALRRIAARGIAVVAMNQVTGYSANAFDELQPALGASVC